MKTILAVTALLLGIGRGAFPPVSTRDCSTVLCFRPICDPSLIYTPPGECCPRCRCPSNFVFRTCATCNSTCANPLPFCTKECKPPQCNCLPPNAIDANGNCINSSSCPSTTQPPVTTSTRDCRLVRCGRPECDEDLWVTPPGQCCPVCPSTTVAPPRCPPNFQFRSCSTCNATCANPNPICIALCQPPSCNCVFPYALDAKGNCIRAGSCPPQTRSPTATPKCDGPNEKFFQFGPCISPCGSAPCNFVQPGPPGCYCKDPINMRLLNEKCVFAKDCPKPCRDRNAEYLVLGLVANRRCFQPYPAPITRGMRPRPDCYCKRGFVLNRFNRCVPVSQCNTCKRSSAHQKTKDLTRYSSCIPALVDVGTCTGTCTPSLIPSRVCPLCDVASYATQRIRCRNLVGAQVFVSIDIVKSCGCRNVISIPTGIQVPRPTRRPVSIQTLTP